MPSWESRGRGAREACPYHYYGSSSLSALGCHHGNPEEEEGGWHVLTIVVTLLDLLCRPIDQHIQRPHHTGDGDDVERDGAAYFPSLTRGHLELFPLQAEMSHSPPRV